jgi:hypothetical protein
MSEAINRSRYVLYVHAGVVRADQKCLLLPAAPGSGKTSITAVLIRSGFRYLSDEVALLEEEEQEALHVCPVPVSLCIKEGAWDLLTPYYPELCDLEVHHRGDGKIVRYLNPPSEVLDSGSGIVHPVGWVVFPRYEPFVQTVLRPLGRGEALRRLLEECLVVPAPLDRSKVERVVRWIGKIPCFEMPMSSLAVGSALLTALCR